MGWKDNAAYTESQKILRAADGPFYFAGDWTSNSMGWQAGAFVGAHRAIEALHARAQAS